MGKRFLTGFLLTLGLFAIALAVVPSITKALFFHQDPPPLNRYGIMFAQGGQEVFFGSDVVQSGPCNIIRTDGKPVVYICTPHLLFPLGPAVPEEPLQLLSPTQEAIN